MTPHCAREYDVIDAITSRRWPERADAELRAHVARCEICADVAEVAGALAHERDIAAEEAVDLPSAQVVWFRAQMRARAEAARRASLPMAWMQALSAACLAGVVATVLGSAAWWLQLTPPDIATWRGYVTGLSLSSTAVQGALIMLGALVLAPITVYLVSADFGTPTSSPRPRPH